MDKRRERGGRMDWEIGLTYIEYIYTYVVCIYIHTYINMHKIASGNLPYRAESPARCSVVTQRDGLGGGEEEVHEGGDLCTHMANSFCCTAEINTTL